MDMWIGVSAMILVGLSWLIWGIVMGRTAKDHLDAGTLVFTASLIALVVSVPLGLLTEGLPDCSWKITAWAFVLLALGGFANNLQLIFMAKAMETGPNGIIWSLTQSGFIFPFFVGVIGYGVPAGAVRICGFAALLTAVFVIGACKEKGAKREARHNWKFWAFLAFFMTGLSQTLSNLPSYYSAAGAVSSIWRTAFAMAGVTAGTPIVFLCTGRMRKFAPQLSGAFRSCKVWGYCLLMELFSLGGCYFLLYPGMDRLVKAGAGAIAYPLMVSSCILGFEAYSMAVLRERRTLVQWFALLLCLAGVVAITLE